MKKKCFTLVLSILILFGFLNSAQSADSYHNSGEFMFKLGRNDSKRNESLLEAEIKDWLSYRGAQRDINLEFYSKIDGPRTSNNDFMKITYAADKKSGTWTTLEDIEFYSIKASNAFAFYWVEGGTKSGTWSTEHLLNNGNQQPTISHLSTWNSLAPPPNTNTPEPATLILLGFGLIGLAGMGRRTIEK